MNNQTGNDQRQRQSGTNAPQGQNPFSIFHILLIGFLITFVLNSLFANLRRDSTALITYNQFINLVDGGCISAVQIEEDKIQMTLADDVNQNDVREILDITEDQMNTLVERQSILYTVPLNDPGLVDKLEKSGVSFYSPYVQEASPFMCIIASWILPVIIFYIIYYFFIRNMVKRMSGEGGIGGMMGGMGGVGKSKAKVYSLEENTGVTFADVAGQDEAKESLMESVEVVIAGKEKKDRIMRPKEKRMVAYHEVGHALATALQKDGQPVQKITIVPRTMGSLGYTMQMPEEERYLLTRGELEAEIVTLLAGRAAEELIFCEATTGASNDIERATSWPAAW